MHEPADERFRLLLEASPEALLIIGEDGVVRAANEAAGRLFGGAVERLVGTSVDELVPDEVRARHVEWRRSYFAAPAVRSMSARPDIRARRLDGSVFHAEIGLGPVEVPEGRFVAASVRDVTEARATARALEESRRALEALNADLERRVAERIAELAEKNQALRQERDRAQRFLDVAGVLFIALDAEGRVTLANREAVEVLGWGEQELVGRDWFEHCIPPDARAAVREVFRQVVDGQVPPYDHYENEVLTRSGGVRLVDWQNTLLRDDDGAVVGTLSSGTDVTERRRAEASLSESFEVIEAANRELEAFNYTVSHDLRAPLRSLQGFSYLLGEEYGDQLDAQGRAWLDRIAANAEHMSMLIDSLLELSRVSRRRPRSEPVDLAVVAREVIAELVSTAADEVPVEWVIPETLPARGDPVLLRLALRNLLDNARKFSRSVPHPRVELGQRDGAWYVRDNGVGFAMDFVDKLFRPFQRLHRAEEFEGTGVGLAAVQRIVARHGGAVWAEARVGAGATFYFTLAA